MESALRAFFFSGLRFSAFTLLFQELDVSATGSFTVIWGKVSTLARIEVEGEVRLRWSVRFQGTLGPRSCPVQDSRTDTLVDHGREVLKNRYSSTRGIKFV